MVTAGVSGQVDCVATSATIVNQIGVKNPARVFESEVRRSATSTSPSA